MSRRDEEIKRLINYAKGHGLRVTMSTRTPDPATGDAYWTLDGTQMVVNTHKRQSKINIVLSLVHELGHHLWFIHEKNRQPDLKFENAIARTDKGYETGRPPGKRYRKKILNVEIAGTLWWDTICKDTDIRIPKWRLDLQKEFDIWQYQVWYETGKDATRSERINKFKELKSKWKAVIYEK